MVIPIIIISPETQFDILYQIEFQIQPIKFTSGISLANQIAVIDA